MKRHTLFIASLGILYGSLIATQTTESKKKLSDFAYNTYSQFGEDGIIEKIFEVIGTQSKLCIEFGAWDGFYLSNTARLWSAGGWRAILIECDASKFRLLVEKTKPYPCTCICARVGNTHKDSLEAILEQHHLSGLAVDLLSIDIDGNDYYVFESLTTLHPRVIICEFNPTMPPHLDIYFPYDNYWGCSVGALRRIARDKGYELVAVTEVNCIFVTKEEVPKFAAFETSFEQIKLTQDVKYVITSYGGLYITVGERANAAYGLYAPYQGPAYVSNPTLYQHK